MGFKVQILHSLLTSLLLLAVLFKACVQESGQRHFQQKQVPHSTGTAAALWEQQHSPHHPWGPRPARPRLPAHPALPRGGCGQGGLLPSAPHPPGTARAGRQGSSPGAGSCSSRSQTAANPCQGTSTAHLLLGTGTAAPAVCSAREGSTGMGLVLYLSPEQVLRVTAELGKPSM